MEKIEELILYILKQEERIKSEELRVKSLEERLEKLERNEFNLFNKFNKYNFLKIYSMRNIFSIIITIILVIQFALGQNKDFRQSPAVRSIVKQNEINAALESLRPDDSIIVNQNSLGEQLKRKLVNKTKLNDIMFVVDSFYYTISPEIKNNGGDGLVKYKQWKRWEYMMSKQVNPDGSFVNSAKLIMRADEEETRKNNGKNRSQLPGSWNNIGVKK
ncbi:MAG: hypothetical protein IPO92_10465 [Saprospiraceae bacterium]|nr:hypothetical protein [Saprospiraceae bacterium]